MDWGGHLKTRRGRTRSPPIPRDITPPALKRPPPPREEGDPYDELLDYDSDTYEYRWNRPTRRYKLSDFSVCETLTSMTDDEARREWELKMAQRRNFLSRGAEPLRINTRPRFAGVGSVEERVAIYRQAASTAEGGDV